MPHCVVDEAGSRVSGLWDETEKASELRDVDPSPTLRFANEPRNPLETRANVVKSHRVDGCLHACESGLRPFRRRRLAASSPVLGEKPSVAR